MGWAAPPTTCDETGRGQQHQQSTEQLVRGEATLRVPQRAPGHPGQEDRHEHVQGTHGSADQETDGRLESAGSATPDHGTHEHGQQRVDEPETVVAQGRIQVSGAMTDTAYRAAQEMRGTEPGRDQGPQHAPDERGEPTLSGVLLRSRLLGARGPRGRLLRGRSRARGAGFARAPAGAAGGGT